MKVAQFEKPHVLNVTSKSLRALREGEVLVQHALAMRFSVRREAAERVEGAEDLAAAQLIGAERDRVDVQAVHRRPRRAPRCGP